MRAMETSTRSDRIVYMDRRRRRVVVTVVLVWLEKEGEKECKRPRGPGQAWDFQVVGASGEVPSRLEGEVILGVLENRVAVGESVVCEPRQEIRTFSVEVWIRSDRR